METLIALVECTIQTSHRVRWAFCRLVSYWVGSKTWVCSDVATSPEPRWHRRGAGPVPCQLGISCQVICCRWEHQWHACPTHGVPPACRYITPPDSCLYNRDLLQRQLGQHWGSQQVRPAAASAHCPVALNHSPCSCASALQPAWITACLSKAEVCMLCHEMLFASVMTWSTETMLWRCRAHAGSWPTSQLLLRA